jgi:hypothetical protein
LGIERTAGERVTGKRPARPKRSRNLPLAEEGTEVRFSSMVKGHVAAELLCGALFVGLTTLKGYFYINLGGTHNPIHSLECVLSGRIKLTLEVANKLGKPVLHTFDGSGS